MASLAIGSLCKPTSSRYSSPIPSSSSFATGSQASKFLQISKSDKNSSLRLQQRHSNKNMDKIFEPLALHKMNKDKFELNATSTNNPQFDATHDLKNPIESVINFLDVLYRFTRPYAAVGTVLSVASMSLLTVNGISDFTLLFFIKALHALVGGLFMQMYVCGFNQICDIELDKVNKPSLPLAAGELSMTTAIVVSSLSAFMSLAIGWLVCWLPTVVLGFGWVVYCWDSVFGQRAALFAMEKVSFYSCDLHADGSGTSCSCWILLAYAEFCPWSIHITFKPLLFAVAMLSGFSVSMIFFKDIPDIEGDRMHGIKSLAIKLGVKQMYWICIWILEIAYIAAAFVGATSSISWSKYVTIISHLGMGLLLWVRAKSVDLKNMEAIQSMYYFFRQLLLAEYGLIALVR